MDHVDPHPSLYPTGIDRSGRATMSIRAELLRVARDLAPAGLVNLLVDWHRAVGEPNRNPLRTQIAAQTYHHAIDPALHES
jgi:hypothetical protein